MKNDIDLTEEVTIRDDIKNIPAGSKVTVDKLIYYAITYSDNNSYFELIRKYGKPVFNKYAEELGTTCRLKSGNFCDMSAYEAAVFFKDIYKFASENEKGKYLIEYMKRPVYNQQIGRDLCKLYPVAQKYGASYNLSVFHSAAIVYAQNPYVLTVYTDFYPTQQCTKVFRDIAAVIDEINTTIAEQQAIEVFAREMHADRSTLYTE